MHLIKIHTTITHCDNMQFSIISQNVIISHGDINPVGIYLLKVNNRNTRTSCEICSKLTKKTRKRRQWCRSSVFIANFEHISHIILVFLLLTLNM